MFFRITAENVCSDKSFNNTWASAGKKEYFFHIVPLAPHNDTHITAWQLYNENILCWNFM